MPEQPTIDDAQAAEENAGGPRVAIARIVRGAVGWVLANRLKAGLGALGVLVAMGGAVGGVMFLQARREAAEDAITIDVAMQALDAGDHEAAREFAERLRSPDRTPYAKLGGPLFVLGAVASHNADVTWGEEQVGYYSLSAGYLEGARDRGFPRGRDPEALYLLGRSLFHSGQIPASREPLRAALDAGSNQATEIHRLLAEAYLKDAAPNFAKALEHNAQYLADRMLSPTEREQGVIQKSWILLGADDLDGARQALDALGAAEAANSEAAIIAGVLLMERARRLRAETARDAANPAAAEIDALYRQAIQKFREGQGRDTFANQSSRKSLFLIGMAQLEMRDPHAALEQFARTRRLHFDTAEGFAASLEEAELLRSMNRNEEALVAYRRTLGAIGDVHNYSNRWIAFEPLRERILDAYQNYLDIGKFAEAAALAEAVAPLVDESHAVSLEADAYSRWGFALLARVEHTPASEAEALAKEGRLRLRQAGAVYARLARLQVVSRDFPRFLWESAQNYHAGHDFDSAIRQYRVYMENESRARRPRALLGLGQALFARGEVDEALKALDECIRRFPRDAASFEARLAASKARLELGETDEAAALLVENLDGGLLTPQSREWRDSLFDLARLLHYAGRHEEAALRLRVALARWPDDPRAAEAAYLLAESNRQRARQLEADVVQQSDRRARNAAQAAIDQLRADAIVQYDGVVSRLTARQQKTELTALETATLRNCQFGRATMLSELGRHADAIDAYVLLTSRYERSPEVLQAYLRIAESYRRLDQPVEARAAVEQAKIVLSRLPADAAFTESTIYTKDEWSQLLDWMGTL